MKLNPEAQPRTSDKKPSKIGRPNLIFHHWHQRSEKCN